MDNVHLELEELTGQLVRGDVTPVVHSLLKTREQKEACLAYLNKKVKKKKSTTKPEVKAAPDFATWFSSFKEVR